MNKQVASVVGFLIIIFNLNADIDPFSDSDDYVNYKVYVQPGNNVEGEPLQAEVRSFKGKELDQFERDTIQKNLNLYFYKEQFNNADEDLAEPEPDKGYIKLAKPVYAKEKEKSIKNMPILDQGQTSTCVTFASTAAVNTFFENGNNTYSIYKSLCLGQALSMRPAMLTGSILRQMNIMKIKRYNNPWNGHYIPLVLSQFKSYGLVKEKDQNTTNGHFAAKLPRKPIGSEDLKKFKKIPDFDYGVLYTSHLGSVDLYFKTEADFTKAIKEEIDKGNLVLIGLNLAEYPEGNMGMLGNVKITGDSAVFTKKKQKNSADYDTWCMDEQLIRFMDENSHRDNVISGHAMLMIGYIENEKNKNEGVFILRNSWGPNNGDNGNNYVTFRYAYYLSGSITFLTSNQSFKKGYL